ncbi:hypothetical protein CYY_000289 [Polysphondylium violaceum]|uniref:Uncharacterized protein n=1 Tax=Polysphondylium violaceum TaxID=133409 RepID=A0A8J4V951_9MYCE|nr:hypothetical protein CYY_000289 [Polysphondylium violaceum]
MLKLRNTVSIYHQFLNTATITTLLGYSSNSIKYSTSSISGQDSIEIPTDDILKNYKFKTQPIANIQPRVRTTLLNRPEISTPDQYDVNPMFHSQPFKNYFKDDPNYLSKLSKTMNQVQKIEGIGHVPAKLTQPFSLDSLESQRYILTYFHVHLGFKSLDSWYTKGYTFFSKLGLMNILERYNYSIPKLMMTVFPDYDWKINKFVRSPLHWDDLDVHRFYIEKEILEKKGFKATDIPELAKLPKSEIFKHNIRMYIRGNYVEYLKLLYPQYTWSLKDFHSSWYAHYFGLSEGNWKNNVKIDFDLNPPEKWYDFKFTQSSSIPRTRLAIDMILERHPQLKPWEFKRFSWECHLDYVESFINHLKDKLSIKDHTDWYKVTKEDIKPASEELFIFLLKRVYPDYKFLPPLFKHIKCHDHVLSRQTLEEFGQKNLGITQLDDWYTKTSKDVEPILDLLIPFKAFGDLIMKSFPKHNWIPSNFINFGTKETYNKKENIIKILKEIQEKNPEIFKTMDDFHDLQQIHYKNDYPYSLIRVKPKQLVSFAYPDYPWITLKFISILESRNALASITDLDKDQFIDYLFKMDSPIKHILDIVSIEMDDPKGRCFYFGTSQGNDKRRITKAVVLSKLSSYVLKKYYNQDVQLNSTSFDKISEIYTKNLELEQGVVLKLIKSKNKCTDQKNVNIQLTFPNGESTTFTNDRFPPFSFIQSIYPKLKSLSNNNKV